MDFINLHTSVLDSAEYKAATVAQRGTWLSLYRYCAGQENSGRIEGAKAWGDRYWRQICGVSLREVRAVCSSVNDLSSVQAQSESDPVSNSNLCSWDGDSLVVKFYNLESEANVHRLRSQAVAGAHARWHRKGMPEQVPQGMPDGIPQGTPQGMPNGNAKGKGKEGNEKEGKETGRARARGKPLGMLPAEQPSPVQERMLAVNELKHRRPVSRWSTKEWDAFKAAGLDTCSPDDFAVQIEPLAAYYGADLVQLRGYWNAKKPDDDFRRRDLESLLNNWAGEVDRATAWCLFMSKKLETAEAGRL